MEGLGATRFPGNDASCETRSGKPLVFAMSPDKRAAKTRTVRSSAAIANMANNKCPERDHIFLGY